MKVAVSVPICKDRNIISGKSHIRPGGGTYYTGVALARLGVDTVVLGTCGKSAPEWPGLENLRLVKIPVAGTIEFVNEYADSDRDNRRQQAVVHDNSLTTDVLDRSDLDGCDYIVLGPLLNGDIPLETVKHLSTVAPLVLAAQGVIRYVRQGKIIWDHPERLLEMLPYCHLAAMDAAELRFFSGREYLDEGAAVLLDAGVNNLIVTRGSRGSVLITGGTRYDIPAYPPRRTIDPTGAGDSYLAGYLRATELYGEPERRGEFAAMTATISLESEGAFAGSCETVIDRLKNL